MDANKLGKSNKCKVCKQYQKDITIYEELSEHFLTEQDALNVDRFRVHFGLGEIGKKIVPSVKLTSFVIYDKYNHVCPIDTGLLEKGIDLFFSGYIKIIDNEDSSTNHGILIQDAGPIKEWWIYGYDGGEKSYIGLSTEFAMYYLMSPAKEYEDIFQNVRQKNELSKRVIEFLLDFGYQNPTFEDLIEHLKNFDFPEVEELLFREAQFICNQIISYDEETVDEVPMISFTCIQTLINLTGVSLNGKKTQYSVKNITKNNISFPKIVSTKLVRDIFEKCFSEQLGTDTECCNDEQNNKNSNFVNLGESNRSDFMNNSNESNNELGSKPVKHKECSKLIIHNVEWVKKNSVKYNGNQGYSSANVDDFLVQQGDYVMLQAEEPNEPLRIAKVCYMYDSPIEGAMFHAHFFCRATDTILGQTANSRELFVVDDCDNCPLGCVVQKAGVEFISYPENWTSLGNNIGVPLELEDDGKSYYFSKIYDYEFSKFRDCADEILNSTVPCVSCKWQKKIKNEETPTFKDDCITWRNNTFKIGTAVFLEPGQSKYIHKVVFEEEKHNIDDKLHTEIYRKGFDLNRGSNLDTPEPFTVGLIENIRQQKKDIKIKVRMFYRPEDTRESHFLAYVSNINYLFWTTDVIWTTFKYVAGKCYVRYAKDEYLAKKWSEKGPFRFYYSTAYDHKNHCFYDVPFNARKMCPDIIDIEKVCLTRRNLKNMDSNYTENAPAWQKPGEPLKCMDIYAGCGGLSEGLHQSGVAKTLWAIEKEIAPAQAYQINNPQCQVFIDDCNNVLEALLNGKNENSTYPDKGDVDLLVGGPPCQGYSGMNRFSSGQYSYFKNSQIITYLSYIDYYRPKYFIFENVRNFVSFKKCLVFKLTLKCLLEMGYQISFGILQAGNFGIPQTRRRFILMGAAPGYTLPNLPDGLHVFSKSGTCLSILVDGLRYDTGSNWSESLPYRTICVRDAIADLPDIENGAMEAEIPYDDEAKSYFQICMRKSNNTGLVKDHICKEMSLIVAARISHIPTYPGSDWRDLPNINVQLKNGFAAKVLKYPYRKKNQNKFDPPRGVCKCVMGKPCDPSDRQSDTLIPWFLVHTADRHNNWVAVYGRLEWDGFFGTTITNPEPTGTQGRVLHPDQNRVVSVRECARSQGFSDNYKFCGNILDKHRQIGNAVPPPLALALGREIIKACNTDNKKV